MADNQLQILYRHRWRWHILYWVATFVVYWITFAGYQDRYYEEFIMNLYLLPARMLGTYTLIYLILPLAIDQKKFVLFGILVVIHAVLYGLSINLTFYFANPFPEFYDFSRLSVFGFTKVFTNIIINYGVPGLAAAIVIFKRWHRDALKNQRLSEENLAAELNFLKAQIHPHFLFNTLNNLYGLALTKSERTAEVVLKLSDLLDYMIYKSNDDFVPLAKELEILHGYIDLEKMRYNERLEFEFELTGKTEGHSIAPFVLLPFVENCFKHGASNDRAKPVILIRVEIHQEYLLFVAINSISNEHVSEDGSKGGIGLVNVKRRLELIYPDKHELDIRQEDKQHRVELKICWK